MVFFALQLFILAQMAVGCYLTNHSVIPIACRMLHRSLMVLGVSQAIFANATTCPLFEDLDTALDSSKSISRLGATRQEALASILDQINLQIERQLRLPLETPGDVVEYLTIWHLALVHCGGSQSIATIRLKLLQAVMHLGVSKFREYEPLLEATALIRSALCPIAVSSHSCFMASSCADHSSHETARRDSSSSRSRPRYFNVRLSSGILCSTCMTEGSLHAALRLSTTLSSASIPRLLSLHLPMISPSFSTRTISFLARVMPR